MAHHLAHGNDIYGEFCGAQYSYDLMSRLVKVDDSIDDEFDEIFAYDALGRIVAQRRDTSIAKNIGGEYAYYANTNRLKSVANGMGGTADERTMSDTANFVYDSEGNLVEDRSKGLKISYDWRGMPVEFTRNDACIDIHEQIVCGSMKLVMAYDGEGRRISKTHLTKSASATNWEKVKETRYTGIGTEIRTGISGNGNETKVVVNMPQGLGRYGIESANTVDSINAEYEWYLKNHLGSTMAVYRTTGTTAGSPMLQHAYDYRSYGEKIDLTVLTDKVTENYTGKELDDEIELGYWGARYLDLKLGLWISVDPKRQFSSPYLYVGNGNNPINGVDPDGNEVVMDDWTKANYVLWLNSNVGGPEVKAIRQNIFAALESSDQIYHVRVKQPVDGLDKGTKGMYDSEYQAAMYDGTMENFFHELLAHAGLDEAIYERSGITLGNSNWFEPENNGREHFLDDEIRARGMGNSQTPANLMDIIEEYGNFYDLHYIDEVDVKE